jgi:DNA-binding LacI/PurR family transcriptional regulator
MSSMVQVAKEAKVAVSTVSLTLNHRERVKPETRERIEAAMRRLGYKPREKKSASRPRNTSMRIALIYTLESLNRAEDSTMTSYCRDIIAGMQEYMAGSNSFLSVFRGVDHVDHDVMVNEQVNASGFDGVIVFGADPHNGYLERIQQSGLPTVAINRIPEHGKFSCVTLDYYGGGQLAIDYLVEMGHRRIGCIQDDESGKWLNSEISQSIRDATRRHGIEITLNTPVQKAQTPDDFRKIVEQIRQKKVTAVFTGDYLAIRLIETLNEAGLNVPDDVSVIGFDDRGLKTPNGLELSTIGYDKRRMGRLSVRMLQNLTRSQGKLRWLVAAVSTHLVRGQTVKNIAE